MLAHVGCAGYRMKRLAVNVVAKSQGPHRIIWRFAWLSIGAHALLAILWLDPVFPVRLFPAPELAVTLSERTGRPVAVPIHMPSPVAVVSAPALKSAVKTATQDAPLLEPRNNDVTELDEQQRQNHLQSLLHAAFETHFIYPALARRQGWQGRVQVALRVEADGRFSQLRVLRSSGYASLDQDALQTLERIGHLAQARLWLDGRAMQVELPVVYRLLES